MTETIVYMSYTTYFRAGGSGPIDVAIRANRLCWFALCMLTIMWVGCNSQVKCVQIALERNSEMVASQNLPDLPDEPKHQ